MNPEHDTLEVRITALLMGELPPEQATALEAQIAADPQLAALHARLRHAIDILRESRVPTPPLQLSADRRASLLAAFRGIAPLPTPAPLKTKTPRDWKTLVPLGLAAVFMAMMGVAMFQPASRMSRRSKLERESVQDGDADGLAVATEAAPSEAEPSEVHTNNSDYFITDGTRAWQSQAGAVHTLESPVPTSPPSSVEYKRSLGTVALATASPSNTEADKPNGSGIYLPPPTTDAAAPATINNATSIAALGDTSGFDRSESRFLNGRVAGNAPAYSATTTVNGGTLNTAPTAPAQRRSTVLASDAGVAQLGLENADDSLAEVAPQFGAVVGDNSRTDKQHWAFDGDGVKENAAAAVSITGTGTLKFFQMPVAEPHAISEPVGTAGRVNVNSEIAPFAYRIAPAKTENEVTKAAGAFDKDSGDFLAEDGEKAFAKSDEWGERATAGGAGSGVLHWTGEAQRKPLAASAEADVALSLPAARQGVDRLSDIHTANEDVFWDTATPELLVKAKNSTANQPVPVPDTAVDALFSSRDVASRSKGEKAKETVLTADSVEFEGFINYGSPILPTSQDGASVEAQNTIRSQNLRIFSRREVTTHVTTNDESKLEQEDRAQLQIPLGLTVAGAATSADSQARHDLQPDTAGKNKVADNKPAGPSLPGAMSGKMSAGRKSGAPAVPEVLAKLDGAKKTAEVTKQLQDVPALIEAQPAQPKAPQPAPVPQPEVLTKANAFSTFSLNVSDVSFKLASASLEKGAMPEPASVRTEEFINAFDYHDPEPAAGAPLSFACERARDPFTQNRDLLRLSVKTAAAGRAAGHPLNLVLLLDNSGSMERADRVRIVHEALRVLSAQLQPQDKLSIVTFARTPRLWADGVAGDKAGEVTARVGEITPQGGTDIAAALDLGYATALRHYQIGSINRVVLLTDGAANLGDVSPAALKQKVETHRKQGVAFDCFGVGWEGYNDDLLEQLSRNGDGRYGFINTPEAAATEFAGQLAGALRLAASDVKVQVEFNPRRVTSYRQLGYAKHQLKKEQFRDNTVDAAELGAAESGNALYAVEVDPRGEGDLATVRVRFKVPGTGDYREHEWAVPFTAPAPPLEQSSSSLRLAASAAAFSEMLTASPHAGEVTTDRLLALLNGIPASSGADARPAKLEWMIRQAKSLSGR